MSKQQSNPSLSNDLLCPKKGCCTLDVRRPACDHSCYFKTLLPVKCSLWIHQTVLNQFSIWQGGAICMSAYLSLSLVLFWWTLQPKWSLLQDFTFAPSKIFSFLFQNAISRPEAKLNFFAIKKKKKKSTSCVVFSLVQSDVSLLSGFSFWKDCKGRIGLPELCGLPVGE